MCRMSNKPIMFNMTSKEYTYTIQVTANKFVIWCLRETFAYQRGGFMILPSPKSEEALQLLYNSEQPQVV